MHLDTLQIVIVAPSLAFVVYWIIFMIKVFIRPLDDDSSDTM